MDIDSHYKSYSSSTRKSLEAWSGSQLDLGLVCLFRVLWIFSPITLVFRLDKFRNAIIFCCLYLGFQALSISFNFLQKKRLFVFIDCYLIVLILQQLHWIEPTRQRQLDIELDFSLHILICSASLCVFAYSLMLVLHKVDAFMSIYFLRCEIRCGGLRWESASMSTSIVGMRCCGLCYIRTLLYVNTI